MEIEKILAVIDDREYPFSTEVIPSEEGTFYRVTPDVTDRVMEEAVPSYIEFDEQGNVQMEEKFSQGKEKEIAEAIWRAVQEQVINKQPAFIRPLQG
jgi:hypothetical protein